MRARGMLPVLTGVAWTVASVPRMVAQQPRPSAQAGVEYRTVSFGAGIGRVSEFAVPLGILYAVSDRLTVDAGTYLVSARLSNGGSTTSLTGVTDVVVRGAYQLKPDAAVFTVALNLPVGQKTINANQALLANQLATDLVPFPVTNFGTGFSVTTGLALAAPVGDWALGVAGSYRYNGSYQPLSDTALTLNPGGELRVRLGADRVVGQGRVSFGVTYSTFSSDEYGGTARNPGARFIPQASWTTPLGGSANLAVYGWDVRRSVKDTAQAASYLNTVTLGALLSIKTGIRNAFRPQLEFRQQGGLSSGHLFAVIARYQVAASDRLTLIPGARFDAGSLSLLGGGSASVTGFSASLTARASF